MTDQAKNFKALIDVELANAEQPQQFALMGGVPNDFCKVWPQAKPTLQMVSGLVMWIPGPGAAASGVLRGLIAVGDQVYGQSCKL